MDYFAEQDKKFRGLLDSLPNLGADANPRVSAVLNQLEKERQEQIHPLTIALLLADLSQTNQIAKNPTQYYEKNKLLGQHPSTSDVNKYFGANIIGNLLLNAYAPGLGHLLNLATIGIQAPTVANNLKLGLRP
jgi:hypothetical protein